MSCRIPEMLSCQRQGIWQLVEDEYWICQFRLTKSRKSLADRLSGWSPIFCHFTKIETKATELKHAR